MNLTDRTLGIPDFNEKHLILNRLKLMALNMFKWENLPNGLTSDLIEKTLYYYGQGVLYNHKDLGYVFLKCSESGKQNIFEEPITVIANGLNESEEINVTDTELEFIQSGIRCKNNDLCLPTHHFVVNYTNKMYEVEKAININIKQQKFPFMVATNTNKILSDKELEKKYNNGEMFIFHQQDYDLTKLQALNFNVPYVADKLQIYKSQLENEILTFFGDNNANTEKRERLIVDEVNANNQLINKMVDIFYKTRLDFQDMMNELTGGNAKVHPTNQLLEKERGYNESNSGDKTDSE